MVGADTIIRLIATVVFALVLLFVVAVGYSLMDPIYNNVIDESMMTGLGWGSPQDTIMLFAGLGLIGMGLVVVLWWIVSPIRDDVRQEQRRPPF